jgi:hypothetical protein
MRHLPQHIARTPALLATALVIGSLTACGGGGGASTDAAAADTTFTGTLTAASNSQPIAGASISVALKTSATPLTATSTSDGHFSLAVPTSALNTASSAVVTITANGYAPCSIEVSNLQASGGARALTACSQLSAVVNGSYAPLQGAVLTRLGNNASGTNDTLGQLSTVAAATSATINLGTINSTTAGGYANFVVNLKMRGLESPTCADTITLYQTENTPLLTAQYPNLVRSDASGAFSPYSLTLPVSALAATGDLYIKVESGACGSAPADQSDDFEFYGITGQFTGS